MSMMVLIGILLLIISAWFLLGMLILIARKTYAMLHQLVDLLMPDSTAEVE